MHYRANPLPIYFPRSFEGQGHIVEKLYTYQKVYVQSFRSLALILHTERENLLKTPRMCEPLIVNVKHSLMDCYRYLPYFREMLNMLI